MEHSHEIRFHGEELAGPCSDPECPMGREPTKPVGLDLMDDRAYQRWLFGQVVNGIMAAGVCPDMDVLPNTMDALLAALKEREEKP